MYKNLNITDYLILNVLDLKYQIIHFGSYFLSTLIKFNDNFVILIIFINKNWLHFDELCISKIV